MDFTLALLLAAGMLAAWLDVRLDERRPEGPSRRMAHAAAGVFALFGSVGVLYLVHGVPQAVVMAVVLTVFLPALVYALLAGFWLLRALAELARLAR
jgi:hypothetical protein